MNVLAIDVSKLLKAQKVFERFRQDMQDDRDQAGAVRKRLSFVMNWHGK